MSTYLVAFVVSNFVSYKDNRSIIQTWSRADVVNQTYHALEFGGKILKYLEDKLGQVDSLQKIDLVALPDFRFGAMENWGLVTFREVNMLIDEEYSSISDKQKVASVVSHEIAHIWFGNLVTPLWWNYLWLSEAFARYFEYMATGEVSH